MAVLFGVHGLRLGGRLDSGAIVRPGALVVAEEPAHAGLAPAQPPDTNPGRLRFLSYFPRAGSRPLPLVVVLHGGGQDAETYAAGAGWSALAQRCGFALLCPEQSETNNAARCFNWYRPFDVSRGSGEAASIAAVVESLLLRPDIDPRRVFVTGLSAGAAMACAMLAAYPELFAGGALIAGLPYRCAETLPQALAAMRRARTRSSREWASLVRSASAHQGSWPRISIWHSDADATVAPSNAPELIKQWTEVHGAKKASVQLVQGHTRTDWVDSAGRLVVEGYALSGVAHGTPLATVGPDGLGATGPYLLEAGISSTLQIARFWGRAPGAPARTDKADGALVRALAAAGLRG